jgi:hypothetical protein
MEGGAVNPGATATSHTFAEYATGGAKLVNTQRTEEEEKYHLLVAAK